MDTMIESGYKVLGHVKNQGYILQEIETGNLELWSCNKGHSSYGIKYNNTKLEFITSLKSVYFVVKNEFNKHWYPDIVGKYYINPPAYAMVKEITGRKLQ